MHHPTLISLKSDLKRYEIMLRRKYKDRVKEYTDIIILQTSNKMCEYKIIFETIESPSKKNEIFYFKHIKTKLLAIIHLCTYIKTMELNNKEIKDNKKEKYYLKQLTKCYKEISKLDYYYSYYITLANHYDDKFFIRIKIDVIRTIDNHVIEIDCRVNTPYLFLFAKSEALYHYKKYIKLEISKLNSKHTPGIEAPISPIYNNIIPFNLKWTAPKASLIELIYAIHAAESINNGNVNIKDIADGFHKLFNIDLTQQHRIFTDIKSRKNQKTKYLDLLKKVLIHKVKTNL